MSLILCDIVASIESGKSSASVPWTPPAYMMFLWLPVNDNELAVVLLFDPFQTDQKVKLTDQNCRTREGFAQLAFQASWEIIMLSIALILLPTSLEFPCGRGHRIIHGSEIFDAAPFPVLLSTWYATSWSNLVRAVRWDIGLRLIIQKLYTSRVNVRYIVTQFLHLQTLNTTYRRSIISSLVFMYVMPPFIHPRRLHLPCSL